MTIALPQRLLLATHNRDKLAEFEALLGPRGIEVVGAGEAGLEEPEETETTFRGNAALKAEAASRTTGIAALSDDSGLTVDGLGGDPGVYSARWAGPERNFSDAMGRVLKALGDAGHGARNARGASFVAVLALARPGEDTLFFEGVTRGHIAPGPRGVNGFGYDPIFIPDDGDGRTFGEMSATEKHGEDAPLSHRARAVRAFMQSLGDPG
ncbi:MAG: RdgB/HAM1 family non-canonical purine NTP pyrophosphatase [Pseudomonadota bacterium]